MRVPKLYEEMSEFRIDEVYSKADIGPVLVNFQNGYTTDGFKRQDCLVLQNEETQKRYLATEVDDMIYHGPIEQEELGKNLLLARNKYTGKVRLIEAYSAMLKPVLKNDNETSQLLETSNLELSRKFGSKKQKKQMEQREKLKVNVKTVKEQMKTVAETITEEKLDIASYNKADSDEFYLPPMDKNADKPEYVYDIYKILTEDEYEQIYSELQDKDYTSDMAQMIKDLITDRKVSNTHTVLAVYANSLLKLNSTLAKDIQKKGFLACPHSETLDKVIKSNFLITRNNKLTRTNPYKDKSICHLIVFLLLINDFKIDLDAFCKTTKMTVTTGSLKIRVTGATIITVGNKKLAQLKLPLNTKTMFRRKSAKF